eukprot:TRINITY_DN18574_c0_g1_i1.p1 TRINITY_DN18574_c0_g1~~TRINITY_DN18574_c0_g1_i1.p1  ORF type:complete len:213 (+),score=35.10 TRINITY_DN18574_c0_g1_i1:282-920(+)
MECGDAGPCVPELLKDIAVVQHAPWSPGSGGAGNTQHGIDCLDTWLRLCDGTPAKYDLIAFNFGLHDLDNRTAAVNKYTSQLANLTDRLRATEAKLQYHLTTPMMPKCCDGAPLNPAGEGAPRPHCARNETQNLYNCNGVVSELNQRAVRIVHDRGIPVVDLYRAVTDVCGGTYVNCSICRKTPCSYHYTAEGYVMLAKPIAAAMRAALVTL